APLGNGYIASRVAMTNILEEMWGGQTLVLGHRGASAYAPMNTLPAFELAAAQGADGIELDVWLCAGGEQLVILHDATVDHTTDGSGYVFEKSFAELRELDASYQFEAYRGVQIPTLDEVFEAVGRKLLINVEIKADERMIPGTERAVADCIRRHGMSRRVLVSSFSAQVLKNFHEVMPEVPIAFLYDTDTPASEWATIASVPHQAIHPRHTLVDAALMEKARADSHVVNTW